MNRRTGVSKKTEKLGGLADKCGEVFDVLIKLQIQATGLGETVTAKWLRRAKRNVESAWEIANREFSIAALEEDRDEAKEQNETRSE